VIQCAIAVTLIVWMCRHMHRTKSVDGNSSPTMSSHLSRGVSIDSVHQLDRERSFNSLTNATHTGHNGSLNRIARINSVDAMSQKSGSNAM
jgi:hypothetical protein